MKNRYIGERIRPIEDINQYIGKCEHSGIVHQLDFEKAFDSIAWDFLVNASEKFGFRKNFFEWVKLCYRNILSPCLMKDSTLPRLGCAEA